MTPKQDSRSEHTMPRPWKVCVLPSRHMTTIAMVQNTEFPELLLWSQGLVHGNDGEIRNMP